MGKENPKRIYGDKSEISRGFPLDNLHSRK